VNANRRILLYGNSVILGAIGVGLRRCPQFEVTTLATPLEDPQDSDTLKYDILLFDLEASQPEAPFFLLKNHPALVLVGISPGTNLVRVWNSRQLREMSMPDLFELINSGAIGAPNAPEKPLLAENLENRSTISINHFSKEKGGGDDAVKIKR
jgi:hypothetical protein